MKQAFLFTKLKNNNIKCRACSWYCTISPSSTGICGVRQNIEGKLCLLTYGKPLHGLAIDPVEKKPLYHFLPGTKILSFGTFGCNFGCEFCQNWEMSQFPKLLKEKITDKKEAINKLKERIQSCETWMPEKIVEYALNYNIPSIAYTYNEPAIFFEYAYDTAKLAHQNGIKNVFVSNGYESKEALNMIHPYLNAINIDLKSFSEKFYLTVCKAKLKPVLENIKRCYKMGIWTEVTTLIIPTLNDSEEELKKAAEFLVSVSPSIPWHLSAYHPDYKIREISATPIEILSKAYEIGKESGLKYVYIGNVTDPIHSTTYCPKCSEIIIWRNGNYIGEINIDRGKCRKCKTKIEGIWS